MTALLRDPELRSVIVTHDPDVAVPFATIACTFRYWKTVDPTDIVVTATNDTENLASDFFSHTIKDLVNTAVIADGMTVGGGWVLPPVAQDDTVWDPTTNAPY